jgi:hypothetical protein
MSSPASGGGGGGAGAAPGAADRHARARARAQHPSPCPATAPPPPRLQHLPVAGAPRDSFTLAALVNTGSLWGYVAGVNGVPAPTLVAAQVPWGRAAPLGPRTALRQPGGAPDLAPGGAAPLGFWSGGVSAGRGRGREREREQEQEQAPLGWLRRYCVPTPTQAPGRPAPLNPIPSA